MGHWSLPGYRVWAFTAILFVIGNRHEAFSRHMEIYSEFSNLSGVANGAKVRVSGLDAGEVKQIEIPKSLSAKFRLRLQVQSKLRGMIRKDSVVSIETEGVVGDKFISIKKGTDWADEVGSGFTLPSKEPVDMAELIEKGSGLLDDLRGSVSDIRGQVDIALASTTRAACAADMEERLGADWSLLPEESLSLLLGHSTTLTRGQFN